MPTRFAPAPGLLIESLGDGWAAFSPLSGETMLLNDESAAIIELLSERPLDRNSLCMALSVDTGIEAHELGARIDDALPRLLEGGLIVALTAS